MFYTNTLILDSLIWMIPWVRLCIQGALHISNSTLYSYSMANHVRLTKAHSYNCTFEHKETTILTMQHSHVYQNRVTIFFSVDDLVWTRWWMILIYCIIFCMFLFTIIILLIYVLCTGKLTKRKAAEDTTQLYDETANFEGIICII